MSMTENEAIERLQTLNIILTDKAGHKEDGIEKIFTFSDITAICKAIQALEEIQAYRAIGTVEDYWKLNEMCKEYSAIGTIDEFKALKEKNEPKKRGVWKSGHTCCPACERGVVTEDRFCCYCGQALKPKEF